jgi:hypothetical protein
MTATATAPTTPLERVAPRSEPGWVYPDSADGPADGPAEEDEGQNGESDWGGGDDPG